MIEAGILEHPKVDAAFALHVLPDFFAGHYLADIGAVTAAPSWFEIEVEGRGGHASEPEKCINPMDSASRIYLEIQKLHHHYAKAANKTVVCPTMFHSGNAQNIIPDLCTISGTVRTFSEDDISKIHQDLKVICSQEEEGSGARCTLHFRTSMNSVVNHPEMTRLMRETIQSMYGDSALEKRPFYFTGGEDYAFISDLVPSVFLFVGAGRIEKENYPLHNSKFCPDEGMIAPTINLLSHFVQKYLALP